MAGRVAVFLRAVNVGGRKLVAADFKAALGKAGCEVVQTVGAAGNAVVAGAKAGAAFEDKVEAEVKAVAGYVSEAFARSDAELEDVLAGNPFPDVAKDDPAHLHVVFLRRDPEPAAVVALQEKIPGREQARGGPRCLYITYPDGAGTSKVTPAMIEKAMGGRGTARNWNTVRRMAELTAQG